MLITGPDFNLIEAMYLDDESDEAFRNALRAAYEQGRRDAAPPTAAGPLAEMIAAEAKDDARQQSRRDDDLEDARHYHDPPAAPPEATACPQSVCDGGGWLTTVSGRRIPCGACVKAGRVPDLDKKVKLPQSHDWEEKGLTLSLRCKRCHLDLPKLASKKYPSVCDAVSSCSHPTEDIYQTMESSAIMCRRCGQVVSGA